MNNATHTVVTVEAVSMMELYKKQAANSNVKLDISKQTLEFVRKRMEMMFDNSEDKPALLLELMEAAKDMELHALSGKTIDFIKENYKGDWQNHISASTTDMSSADGSDNR